MAFPFIAATVSQGLVPGERTCGGAGGPALQAKQPLTNRRWLRQNGLQTQLALEEECNETGQ